MKATNRIQWVDTMKAFSIMAVVLNHTHIFPTVKTVAYLVCLPVFFFTAGMFTNISLSPKEFFLKKTSRLLIPYLFWGLISWLSWFFIDRHFGADAGISTKWWDPLWGMVCGRIDMLLQNPPLWFLCCMMSLEWLYYCIVRINIKWLRWFVILVFGFIGCLLSILRQNWGWELSAAMIILPLYSLGAENKDMFKEKIVGLKRVPMGLLIVVSLFGIWMGCEYNDDIALARTQIGNPLIYYLSIFAVVGFWFAVSQLLQKIRWSMGWIQFIGRNTLFILCAHKFSFGLIKGIALFCNVSLEFFETTLGCLCLWIGTFVILPPIAILFNRYYPILVGKKS